MDANSLSAAQPHKTEHSTTAGFVALTIGSIGVVYGDIGTSPLYAFREALTAAVGPGQADREAILGVLSLIFWSLLLVVTLKYVILLLRADNNGEGGTLSLTALAFRAIGRRSAVVMMLGMIGAAMFYGSTFITPALSVLSAVEGLKVVAPALEPYILPLTVLILVALFAVQSRGTGKISVLFGPVMLVWFCIIAIAGFAQIASHPDVLEALNPVHAVTFLARHAGVGLATLGFVLLAVTGGEALYADLGHFGRRPIQAAWFYLVLPALTLNYFGQGALLLHSPAAIENPFYRLIPELFMLPVVVLATIATAIASQAVITGAFSITQQAIQLGLLPRLDVQHKSGEHRGQIYVPRLNWILLAGVLALVALFQTSSNLASAYGMAVAAAMVTDGLLAFVVVRNLWRWPLWMTALVIVPLILIDTVFLSATLLNLLQGAWVPVMIGGAIVALMVTWRRGSTMLAAKTRKGELPLDMLVGQLERKPPHIVHGTAVFLTSQPDLTPTALLHNLKHNKMLHERNLIVSVTTEDIPQVREDHRVEITSVSSRFTVVKLRFGFMETPNVPRALAMAHMHYGLDFEMMSTSFYLSRRSLKQAAHSGMPRWQDRLFIAASRSADDASTYFKIPTGRVVEIGTQIAI